MPPKSSNAVPKTVLDKIEHAVRHMADPTGSSRQAIVKFLKREYDVDNANAVKKALKTGVDGGRLLQKGQSFSVKGVEFKPPADGQVTIEEVKEGGGALAEVGSEAGEGGGFYWKTKLTVLYEDYYPNAHLQGISSSHCTVVDQLFSYVLPRQFIYARFRRADVHQSVNIRG